MMKENNTPLVTVGIPTYNRPKGLERTLDCILKQSYSNLEVIVSDNCSIDPEVLQVIKKFAAQDKRVKYYVQEKNLSIVPNFQFLLDKASGEYFMWAADDDFWDKNFIETCVEGLQQDASIVACITDVKIINFKNETLPTKLTRSFMQSNLYSRLYNWVRSSEEVKYFFCGMYRASIVKNIQFQNNWGGDHMFLLELITKGKFLYIPGKSNFYYYRGGSSTNIKKVREAFNIKQRFYFFDWYFIRYVYYPFHFSHLNLFQKTGLFFSNSLGLLLNEEGILFRILIKKPLTGIAKRISKLFAKKEKRFIGK
ncbi:MAG: glycosyltransferase family 2 protein [Bacteroidota bacterium]